MERDASSQPAASSLRHRLGATVCCCFGGGDWAQWGRQRVGWELRYDPLSYALNFDEGEYETSVDDLGDDGGLLVYRGFSSSPPPRSATRAA